MKRFTLRFEFKLADCWIGLFWRRSTENWIKPPKDRMATVTTRPRLDVWICLLPCLPLHMTLLGDEMVESFPCGSTAIENAFLNVDAEMHGWRRTVEETSHE